MSRQNRGLKCGIEALEDRQLLSVTSTLLNGGTILQITGDSASEKVNITQNDVTNELTVSWSDLTKVPVEIAAPASVFQSSTIHKVIVKLGGGDDQLTYQLEGNLLLNDKTLMVDLGVGDDSALFDFGGNLLTVQLPPEPRDIDGDGQLDFPIDWQMPQPSELNANLMIHAKGSAGNDTIDAIFGNIYQGVTYRATGDAGNDTISGQVAGYMNAGANVMLDEDGGAGQDHLRVDLGSRGIDAGALVQVDQKGRAGQDELSFDARLPLYGTLKLMQSGGAGDDVTSAFILPDWQSTGSVKARVAGDEGDDQLKLRVKRDDMPSNVNLFAPLKDLQVNAYLTGGYGVNVAWVTPNVKTFMTLIKNRSWAVT